MEVVVLVNGVELASAAEVDVLAIVSPSERYRYMVLSYSDVLSQIIAVSAVMVAPFGSWIGTTRYSGGPDTA
jgi:hypothetical protein